MQNYNKLKKTSRTRLSCIMPFLAHKAVFVLFISVSSITGIRWCEGS